MKTDIVQFGPAFLQEQLRRHAPGAQRWLVAFSGGLDSTALLSALVAIKPRQPIIAIHVNHGLSEFAEQWQSHCEARCQAWGVECRVEKVTVQARGFGLEDAAREARYKAFAAHMEEDDVLLLGHHRDDQAETLLLRLMRGAGPRGLGGIVTERPFGPGVLLRPLLGLSKAQLDAYLVAAEEDWVCDDSNVNEAFDRNFLRQRVMPLLASRWPNFSERWRRTAEACQQADQLCGDLARLDLAHCDERSERRGWSIDWMRFKAMPAYRRNNLLRSWLRERGLAAMSRRQMAEAYRQFFGLTSPSSETSVTWPGAMLRFYRGRVYALPALPEVDRSQVLLWELKDPLALPGGGILRCIEGCLGQSAVQVRWRQGGERCRPAKRGHSQLLKKLLQEYGLEPWLRDRVPLVYSNGELIAVGDLWLCHGQDKHGLRLEWRP